MRFHAAASCLPVYPNTVKRAVALEQRGASLAEDLVDVGLAQPGAVTQFGDDAVEIVTQRVKHEIGKLAVSVAGLSCQHPYRGNGRAPRPSDSVVQEALHNR